MAIMGKSGSGKSSLLHLLGGLDAPSAGKVYWGDQSIANLSETQKSRLRNQYLGFVYQFHHLLSEFTAVENVAMPLRIRAEKADYRGQAEALLTKIGLGERMHAKVTELSGGENSALLLHAL